MKKINLLIAVLLLTCSCANAQYYVSSIAGRLPLTPADYDTCGFFGDGGLATAALFFQPWDVCRDKAGNLYVADYANARIRKVAFATGIITTIAGGGLGYRKQYHGHHCPIGAGIWRVYG